MPSRINVNSFSSTSLPLASTRWVRLTLSSLGLLLYVVPSVNLSNIKRKIRGNVENWTQGCWVRSRNATYVLYSPRSPQECKFFTMFERSGTGNGGRSRNSSLTWLVEIFWVDDDVGSSCCCRWRWRWRRDLCPEVRRPMSNNRERANQTFTLESNLTLTYLLSAT